MQVRSFLRGAFATVCFAVGGLAATAAAEDAAEDAAGDAAYQPVLQYEYKGVRFEAPGLLRSRFESVETFPVDRYGTEIEQDFVWSPNARIGARIDGEVTQYPLAYHLEYEHDLVTGTAVGEPDIEGEGLPNGRVSRAELRKAFLRVDIANVWAIAGGYMTSHWGLGMLANDGDHGWTPGSAYFGDPRSGDRVLRLWTGTQPLTDYGIVVRAAIDKVEQDDITIDGDDAHQFILSARAGVGLPYYGGLYLVFRDQEAEPDENGHRGFDAVIIDLVAGAAFDLGAVGALKLDSELAIITGETDLAPSTEIRRHDLLQIGGIVRAALDRGNHGLVADVLFATGDQNFDNDEQNAFRMDPNLEVGLLLFRHVIAAQTGRAPVTAADPELVGRPVPDLDRVPSRGSVTNTIAFFPRAWWRVAEPLETYGGMLLAWSDVDYADPLNTRVEGGGDPRNVFGAKPGSFYGAEFDLGARYRRMIGTSEFTLGTEVGVLFPGGAFDDASGGSMDEIFGGRVMVDYRF